LQTPDPLIDGPSTPFRKNEQKLPQTYFTPTKHDNLLYDQDPILLPSTAQKLKINFMQNYCKVEANDLKRIFHDTDDVDELLEN
jgi:hypothetical protein